MAYIQAAATDSWNHFKIGTRIRGKESFALIDNKCQKNLITLHIAAELNIPLKKKDKPFYLTTINGNVAN